MDATIPDLHDLLVPGRAAGARAVLRAGGLPALERCWAALAGTGHDLGAELWRSLSDLAAADGACAADLRRRLPPLLDADPWTRRRAALCLGWAARGDARAVADLAALLAAADPPLWRSVVTALGRAGGERAAEVLAGLVAPVGDAQAPRVLDEARRRCRRDRGETRAADLGRPLAGEAELSCRQGLEDLALASCRPEWRPRLLGPGLLRCRPRSLEECAFLPFHLRAGLVLADGLPEDPAALGAALAGRPLTMWRAACPDGPLRFRLAWEGLADAAARRATRAMLPPFLAADQELADQPRAADWDLTLRRGVYGWTAVASPRGEERRWPWRRGYVPASTNPTLAEALVAWLAPGPADRVFDPCCGAGCELVLAALRGRPASVSGRDTRPEALAAAAANAAAAGVTLALARGDLRDPWPAGTTAVVTSPPLGSRIRDPGLDALFDALRAGAAALPAGGRMAWLRPLRLAPHPDLRTLRATRVDMGGFCVLMELVEPAGRR